MRACAPIALAAVFLAAGAEGTQTAVANGDTRTLSFYHTHSQERLTVTFKKDGRYDQAALKKLNYFLRDWRNQKQIAMEPRLFDVVWEVQKDAGSTAPIQIISAYRSPETNEKLRSRSKGVAKNSQHTLGHAMDIHVPDVPMSKIREAGLRLQRGGVGFYPTSAKPFVHLDVGNVRHWPRMTRDQLVRLFPDGRTVHIPTDGKPLKNYALALNDVKRNGATVRGMDPTMVAEAQQARGGNGKGFFSKLLGDDEDESAPAMPEAPAAVEPAMPPSMAVAAIAEAVPLPQARPMEVVSGPQLAYAPQQMPDMMWQRGPDAHQPSTTPGAAMPAPPPADTTPPALVAGIDRQVIRPQNVQPVAASLAPDAALGASREAAMQMLNQLRASEPQAPAPASAQAALDVAGHIAFAHDAFAPSIQAQARSSRRTEIAAVAAAAIKGSFSPSRTARDRTLALNHPVTGDAALLAAPREVLPSTFGGNPHSGMRSDAFMGASIPVLRTVSFGGDRRTAQLLSPRG